MRFVNLDSFRLVEGEGFWFPLNNRSELMICRDGAYGLYLDDTLYEGTSARSMTFDNEVLCSTLGPRLAGGAVGFECVGVEVWSVVS